MASGAGVAARRRTLGAAARLAGAATWHHLAVGSPRWASRPERHLGEILGSSSEQYYHEHGAALEGLLQVRT